MVGGSACVAGGVEALVEQVVCARSCGKIEFPGLTNNSVVLLVISYVVALVIRRCVRTKPQRVEKARYACCME